MAAGVPQVIFGNPSLLGNNQLLTSRPDLFWVESIEELEALVKQLLRAKQAALYLCGSTAVLGSQSITEKALGLNRHSPDNKGANKAAT